MLSQILGLALKSFLTTAVILTFYFLSRQRSVAERCAILQAGVIALLALPLLSVALPSLKIAWWPEAPAVLARSDLTIYSVNAVRPSWLVLSTPSSIMFAAYGTATLSLLARLAVGVATLMVWSRDATPVRDPYWNEVLAEARAGFHRSILLRCSDRAASPFSWGVSPAWIILDPAALDDRQHARAIIAHEIAHVRRFDWLTLIATRVTTAIYCFNPLVWILARRIALEIEIAADEQALGAVSRHDYADALLTAARRVTPALPVNAMGLPRGDLARRIELTLHERSNRTMSVRSLFALGIASLGLTAPIAAAQLTSAVQHPRAFHLFAARGAIQPAHFVTNEAGSGGRAGQSGDKLRDEVTALRERATKLDREADVAGTPADVRTRLHTQANELREIAQKREADPTAAPGA